ncbi:MAG TPA: class I SAM-dependent methyltransferase [Bryobacteraceae bacterium]|nr:class I SAM-dependent methyltransferase [Bryobacteraceae bacterium]
MTLLSPEPIIDLMEGFRRSKTMFAAVSLGVFDALADGAATAAELSGRLKTKPEPLERLLDACISLGLLERRERVFANTALAAQYLVGSSPDSLTGYVRYSDDALYPLWAHLDDAVREGTPRWQQTFGWSGSIFDNFFRSEDRKREFLKGMHGLGRWASPAVVRAFDLGRFKILADLGAATGHLAIAACEAWPELRAIVSDLPGVLSFAREQVEKSSARDRISFMAADFFNDPLPAADLYALGRVLHDWEEDQIDTLLRRIYHALPRGGALLIAERLLDEDRSGPLGAHMQSLSMLVCTEGRERTLAEYSALLSRAGFDEIRGQRTGRYLDAILAGKN